MYDAKNISKVLSLGSSHCHGFETRFHETYTIKHKIKYPRSASTPQCVFVNYEYDGVMVGIRGACKLLKTLFILNQKYIWKRVADYNNLNLN